MLLRDVAPAKTKLRTRTKRDRNSANKIVPIRQQPLAKIAPQQATKIATPKKRIRKSVPITPTPIAQTPLWLKSLIVLNHGSAVVCYVSVAVALVMYGMTVYGPKLWTQKYAQLQDLQKKERQFTSADEMFKDDLAKNGTQSGSGFVKPNPEKQPIFLPDTPTQPIELKSSTPVQTLIVTPISPIAY